MTTLCVLLLVGLLPAAEDDLSVVRRAVTRDSGQAAASPKTEKPRWLRVRVVEKRSKKAKVAVNLPLALVRALGDECPVRWCRKGDVRLSEVLEALESGKDIVEIEDEQASVRIWVD